MKVKWIKVKVKWIKISYWVGYFTQWGTVQLDATPQMTKPRQIRLELIYRNRIENVLFYTLTD